MCVSVLCVSLRQGVKVAQAGLEFTMYKRMGLNVCIDALSLSSPFKILYSSSSSKCLLKILKLLFVYICDVCLWVYMLRHICGGQRTFLYSQFSFFKFVFFF